MHLQWHLQWQVFTERVACYSGICKKSINKNIVVFEVLGRTLIPGGQAILLFSHIRKIAKLIIFIIIMYIPLFFIIHYNCYISFLCFFVSFKEINKFLVDCIKLVY